MKTAALGLALALLLVGCGPGNGGGSAPEQPLPAPRPAAPTPVTPSPPPTLPAAGAEEETPDPKSMRVAPDLAVVAAQAAVIRTGRARWHQVVAQVPAGAELVFLDSREGWLLVETADGRSGWLSGNEAVLARAGDPLVDYAVLPGRWEMRTLAGVAVTVARSPNGWLNLEVTGQAGPARLVEVGQEAVALLFAAPESRAALLVGDRGVAAVSLSEHGLWVDLENYPVYRLLTNEAGRVALSFGPGLGEITATDRGYLFSLRGDVQPVLRADGDQLLVDLPGAVLTHPSDARPADVSLHTIPPGAAPQPTMPPGAPLTLTVSAAGGVRVRLPATGEPYALYRQDNGRVELRFLTPGLAGKTVVVDAGHGGEDTGAVSAAGYLEKHLNLGVALRLAQMLEAAGARVIMTRTDDARVLDPELAAALSTYAERDRADLHTRTEISNAHGADLFLSIHGNAGSSGERGVETFWATRNLNASRSVDLAQLVQEELLQALGFPNRGVKQRGFYVIWHTAAPAVLAELGFLTHAAEAQHLISEQGQQAAAAALFRAIEQFFQNAPS